MVVQGQVCQRILKFQKTFLAAQNTAACLITSLQSPLLWVWQEGVPQKSKLPVPTESTVPGEGSLLRGTTASLHNAPPELLHLSSINLSQRGFPSWISWSRGAEHPRGTESMDPASRDLASNSPQQPCRTPANLSQGQTPSHAAQWSLLRPPKTKKV